MPDRFTFNEIAVQRRHNYQQINPCLGDVEDDHALLPRVDPQVETSLLSPTLTH